MNKPIVPLIEMMINNSHEYVETRLELFKLKLVDKSSSILSSIASGVAMFLIFFIFFIVINIGIALLIGDLIGKAYLGFFILAALYIIIGLLLFKSRSKWIKGPIIRMFVRKFVKDTPWDK